MNERILTYVLDRLWLPAGRTLALASFHPERTHYRSAKCMRLIDREGDSRLPPGLTIRNHASYENGNPKRAGVNFIPGF